MSALILFLLYIPCLLAVALLTAAIGYALAVKQYSDLFKACELDQAVATSSIEHLRGVTSDLSQRVSQHSHRVIEIEQSLTAPGASLAGASSATLDAAAELRQANEKLQADLSHIKRELDEQTKRLKREQREARIDKTTGFFIRAVFNEALQKSASNAKPGVGGLAIIEIDDFKECNDRYGHVIGDKVLQTVAKAIRAELVGLDVHCARCGDGQLAVIFHKDSRENIHKVLGELRQAIEKSVFEDGDAKLPLRITTGLVMNFRGATASSLETAADKALAAAKRAGKNRTFICEGEACNLLEPLEPTAPSPPQPQAQLQPQPIREPRAKSNSLDEAESVKKTEVSFAKLAEGVEDLATAEGAPRVERRAHKRQTCNATYLIAPYIQNAPPSQHTFNKVRLIDVSGGGCAMLLSARPAANSYLVAITKPGGSVYLVAEVVRVSEQGRDSFGQPVFVAGCRFTNRISEPVKPLAEKAVLVETSEKL
jgi:diguanylate cyclase